MSEAGVENNQKVAGQVVLPSMEEEMGYEVIVLSPPWKERFCWEFVLRGDNGYGAYKKVKPKVKDSTARVEASKLLTNPEVKSRIDQIRGELKRRYNVTADEILQYHGKILKMDLDELIDVGDDGKVQPKKFSELETQIKSIIDIGFDVDKDGNVVPLFSIPSRGGAAIELAKILGLHKERKEISGPDGGPIETNSVVAAEDAAKMNELRAEFQKHSNGSA